MIMMKNIKIKFNSDDELPLNKTKEIHSMIIVVKDIFLWKQQILSTILLRCMPEWSMNNVEMLYYDRTGVSGRISINKTNAWKESDICHYWYFLYKGFKFQTYVCNRCHDLLMMSTNLSDNAILNIKNTDYCCIISSTSKSEAINLLQNINLTDKMEHYKT